VSAWSRDQAPETRIEPRRRTALAALLLSAASLSSGPVRSFLVRGGAINGFASTGNRMLDYPGRLTELPVVTAKGEAARHHPTGRAAPDLQIDRYCE
jgi:hypothetical protein